MKETSDKKNIKKKKNHEHENLTFTKCVVASTCRGKTNLFFFEERVQNTDYRDKKELEGLYSGSLTPLLAMSSMLGHLESKITDPKQYNKNNVSKNIKKC